MIRKKLTPKRNAKKKLINKEEKTHRFHAYVTGKNYKKLTYYLLENDLSYTDWLAKTIEGL